MVHLGNVPSRRRAHYAGAEGRDLASADLYLCNLAMSVLEARLERSRFLRVHRSHIINFDYAAELIRVDDGMLIAIAEVHLMGPAGRIRLNSVARLHLACLALP